MPVEILERIYRYIPLWGVWRATEDVRVLHGLCVSCRYLYRVFKPHLYEWIVVDATDIFLFVRSILHNPDLALFTKTLAISKPPEFDLGKAYTLLHATRTVPRACTQHLHPGDKNALAVLLLEVLMLSLRNVQDLLIAPNWISDSVNLFDTKRWKDSSLNIFPHLDEIEVNVRPGDDGHGNSRALRQLQRLLQAAKRIRAQFDETVVEMGDCYFSLPRLEELMITCDGMELEDLEILVKTCPNIRKFCFSGGLPPLMQPEQDKEWVSVASFITIIQPYKETLIDLGIHFYYPEDYEDYVLPEDQLTSLHDFTVLRRLDLDHMYLWEPIWEYGMIKPGRFKFLDKLPRSLETIRIFLANDRSIDELMTLPSLKPTAFPRLTKLVLECYDDCIGGPDPIPKCLVDLKIQLENAGVAMILE